MSENSTYTEKLIRFIDGELAPEETASLQRILEEEPAIQQEYEGLKSATRAVRYYAVRVSVSNIHSEMMKELNITSPQQSNIRRMFFSPLRVAAALFLLLASFALIRFAGISPGSLYNEKYQDFRLSSTRGNQSLSSMEMVYRNGQYPETIRLYESLENKTATDHFLAGQAFLQLNEPARAIESFQQSIAVNQSFHTAYYLDDAEFYLALAFLRTNQPAKALPLFRKIHDDPDHLYHDAVTGWYLQKLKISVWKSK